MLNLPDADTLKPAYADADPFPHIKVENVVDEDRLRAVNAEIAKAKIDPEAPGYGWFGKRRASDLAQFSEETRKLVEELNGAPFLRWLETVTGIDELLPDPHLEGGGLHQIPPGGYLKVHTDFNWHRILKLHRRVNILLYLNEDWKPEWKGEIELWHHEKLEDAQPTASYAPLFNRMVIFSTTDFSYHGHPEALACPPDRTRNSIALYYYSKDRPDDEVRFGHSEMTNYRHTRDDQLGWKHKAHQALIRHPRLRSALGRVLGR